MPSPSVRDIGVVHPTTLYYSPEGRVHVVPEENALYVGNRKVTTRAEMEAIQAAYGRHRERAAAGGQLSPTKFDEEWSKEASRFADPQRPTDVLRAQELKQMPAGERLQEALRFSERPSWQQTLMKLVGSPVTPAEAMGYDWSTGDIDPRQASGSVSNDTLERQHKWLTDWQNGWYAVLDDKVHPHDVLDLAARQEAGDQGAKEQLQRTFGYVPSVEDSLALIDLHDQVRHQETHANVSDAMAGLAGGATQVLRPGDVAALPKAELEDTFGSRALHDTAGRLPLPEHPVTPEVRISAEQLQKMPLEKGPVERVMERGWDVPKTAIEGAAWLPALEALLPGMVVPPGAEGYLREPRKVQSQ